MVHPLLALDAAGGACSAALWDGREVAAGTLEIMQRGQSERLMPMIDEVVRSAGLRYGELAALAVTTGPGGFTGVRLGLAAARGLALALACPVIGLTSFEAVAAAAEGMLQPGERLVVALDSKREELFLRSFAAAGEALGEAAVVRPEAAAEMMLPGDLALAGEAAQQLSAALAGRPHRVLPVSVADARAFAPWAARRALPAAGSQPPSPVYLRPPDVSQSNKPWLS